MMMILGHKSQIHRRCEVHRDFTEDEIMRTKKYILNQKVNQTHQTLLESPNVEIG